MPKFPTFPTIYDNCKTVSISDLKRWEYLKPNQFKSGLITWSINGNKSGSISIRTNTNSENPYLELDYKCNETPINYRVQLVSIPSNLGKGVVWFFICPRTGKRCRKLHLADIYFYHRSASADACMKSKLIPTRAGNCTGFGAKYSTRTKFLRNKGIPISNPTTWVNRPKNT
jgi:hypothetical protein